MNYFSHPRFLAIYSGILTIAFGVTVFAGFAAVNRRTKFDEIDVKRINLVEPDGTLRLVISDKALFPGLIIKGKEYPHPDRQSAGLIFFNDEGSENGGLIFGGSKGKDSKPESYGHLSFDEYEQDQVFAIDTDQSEGTRSSKMEIIDRPDYPITEVLALPPAERKKFMDAHAQSRPRFYLARSTDQSVSLALKDIQGRDRILLKVAPEGTPSIQLLDEKGKVVSQVTR